MAPKKGKKGKGGGGKKAAKSTTVIDGISTEEMTKEQLEEHIVALREELDREREERNYFQLERDKVNTFWEITKRQLEERKAELRNKDREMEDSEERHQVEIKGNQFLLLFFLKEANYKCLINKNRFKFTNKPIKYPSTMISQNF
jgi:hypothetical protein